MALMVPSAWAQEFSEDADTSVIADPEEAWLNSELDPDSPLAELPDMEVAWPDGQEPLPEFETIESDDEGEGVLDELEEGFSAQDSTAATESFNIGSVSTYRPAQTIETADGRLREIEERETSYIIRVNFLNSQQISNIDMSDIEERFRALSVLREYDDGESNIAQLTRRARADESLLSDIMRVYGYYDAETRFNLSRFGRNRTAASGNVNEITFEVLAGPQYRLSKIELGDLSAAVNAVELNNLYGLELGEPINSDRIDLARTHLDEALHETGYAFAKLGGPSLLIDHAARTGNLDQPVTTGARYRFGDILMSDQSLLSARHLQEIARFDPGEMYQRSKVEDFRRAIVATGLVSSINLEPRDAGQADGTGDDSAERVADMVVELTPAPLRTIAGAFGYGTGEGVRLEASWEHRNFFPPEGMLRFRGVAGTQEQLVGATFRRSNYRGRDKVLTGQAFAQTIKRDAFEAETLTLAATFERQTNLIFQKKWTWSLGVELLASNERDGTTGTATTGRDTFFIASLPVSLGYDGTDDLLNPGHGFRLSGLLAPEGSLHAGTFYYARSQIDASYYQPAGKRVVVAGRMRLGTIVGAGTNEIAPSRRLYSGGGGSVRGYGYQMVGPRDSANDPVGGRSLVELSLEARVRLGDFGVVPFIDAGNVYSKPGPDFTGLRFGAGLGVRYYTSFGPMRLDVATPLNPQKGDSPIAVYISLGQAF